MGKSNTELLKIAQKHLGEGGAKFRKFCGLPSGAAWCNAFVDYIANEGGDASLFFNGKRPTYCPDSIKWCNKNLALVPLYLALPMDIIYFDWEKNGVPNHIGFVRAKKSTSEILTIEGNTSGGIVAQKTRAGKYVQGVYRPHFPGKYTLQKLAVDGDFGYSSIANLQRALKIGVDGILGQGTVKALQKRAGLTGKSIDGAFGPATARAVQKLVGAKPVDGDFGPNSVRKLQEWINKVNYPSTNKKPAETKPATPASKPAPKPVTSPTRKKMTRIGHARADYDHKAGDSSGKEVCKSKFTYSPSSGSVYNWTYVFRPKNITKANKAADMCEKAIANNNIGYNSHGETAYGKAKAMTKLAAAAGYDLSKIKTKCGLSCGDLICLCNRWAGLSKCYQGSGKALAAALKKNSNFECKKYKKGMQLYRGDVLITAHSNGKNNHVVMCL